MLKNKKNGKSLPKIMVIDDDPSILDAIALILSEEGYPVETLSKGEEAFEKVLSSKPQIILLDVLMSGVDGRDICVKLKKSSITKNIPLIMISAHPSAKDHSMKCGAEDFLAKPFDMSELLEKISQYS